MHTMVLFLVKEKRSSSVTPKYTPFFFFVFAIFPILHCKGRRKDGRMTEGRRRRDEGKDGRWSGQYSARPKLHPE